MLRSRGITGPAFGVVAGVRGVELAGVPDWASWALFTLALPDLTDGREYVSRETFCFFFACKDRVCARPVHMPSVTLVSMTQPAARFTTWLLLRDFVLSAQAGC